MGFRAKRSESAISRIVISFLWNRRCWSCPWFHLGRSSLWRILEQNRHTNKLYYFCYFDFSDKICTYQPMHIIFIIFSKMRLLMVDKILFFRYLFSFSLLIYEEYEK